MEFHEKSRGGTSPTNLTDRIGLVEVKLRKGIAEIVEQSIAVMEKDIEERVRDLFELRFAPLREWAGDVNTLLQASSITPGTPGPISSMLTSPIGPSATEGEREQHVTKNRKVDLKGPQAEHETEAEQGSHHHQQHQPEQMAFTTRQSEIEFDLHGLVKEEKVPPSSKRASIKSLPLGGLGMFLSPKKKNSIAVVADPIDDGVTLVASPNDGIEHDATKDLNVNAGAEGTNAVTSKGKTENGKAAKEKEQRSKEDMVSLKGDLETHSDFKEDSIPPFFLHPESYFWGNWNAVLVAGVLYIAVFLPLRTGFHLRTSSGEMVVDVFLDVFFLADMALRFRTGYVDPNTKIVVSSPKTVAERYLKGWFCLDLVSSIPWAFIELASPSMATTPAFTVFQFMKLLRISRLLRLDFVHELESRSPLGSTLVRVLKLLVIFSYSLHLITCFFWLTLRNDSNPNLAVTCNACTAASLTTTIFLLHLFFFSALPLSTCYPQSFFLRGTATVEPFVAHHSPQRYDCHHDVN
jgi:hypothetical protein